MLDKSGQMREERREMLRVARRGSCVRQSWPDTRGRAGQLREARPGSWARQGRADARGKAGHHGEASHIGKERHGY
jgi:hypothetical protein